MHSDVKLHCAKDFLEYVRGLEIRIGYIQSEIESMRAKLELTGIQYREGVATSTKGDKLENGVIALQELIETYCTELAEYVELQEQAHKAVAKLKKAEHAKALTKYYLQHESWEQVCVEMGYSWHGMMKLKRRALIEFYDYMPEEWRRNALPKAV